MRRFLLVPLAALIGVAFALVFRHFFPAKMVHSAPPIETPSRKAGGSMDGEAAQPTSRPAAHVEPWPTGYVALGRRVTVQMSDGTTRIERVDSASRDARLGSRNRHGEVTDIDRNAVVIDGEKKFLKPSARPASPVNTPVQASGAPSAPTSSGFPVPVVR